MARKAMGSTPKTTVGWAAIVACLSALLYFSGQIDSKIDDRVQRIVAPIIAVYNEKFRVTEKQVDDHEIRIHNLEAAKRGK